MRFLLSTIVLLVYLTSSQIALASVANKIIGDDDLLPVDLKASNIPQKYMSIVDAFGLMSNGCTATHIGQGYVLTAGHCFWAKEELQEDQNCSDITIKWSYRTGAPAKMQSKCENIVAMLRNNANDFAILKVFPAPEVSLSVELEQKAQPGSIITIFSHPTNLPLRWSKTCAVESPDVTTLSIYKASLLHKCDTNPGSSGATIIDTGSLKVVGIHGGGRLTSTNEGINYGTFMTNPELQNILKGLGL